jgi:hypothetical protein
MIKVFVGLWGTVLCGLLFAPLTSICCLSITEQLLDSLGVVPRRGYLAYGKSGDHAADTKRSSTATTRLPVR